jgi:hypothetical protein
MIYTATFNTPVPIYPKGLAFFPPCLEVHGAFVCDQDLALTVRRCPVALDVGQAPGTYAKACLLQPRPIKHAHIGFRVAPGGPAVAGRRTNAPPRRTGVPAAGEPKIGPGVRFFSTTRYYAGRGSKHPDISPRFSFESNFRTQSVQGGSRRAPLVVTIHRRPLYFERWNAASMQHDAVTAADLEHCRRWLLEAASHCSSCGA